jgi:hypothetical protein
MPTFLLVFETIGKSLLFVFNIKNSTGGLRLPPRLSLIEKLNLLRSRKSTNPGPILRELPPVVRAVGP